MKEDKENQQKLSSEKLESVTFGQFCFEGDYLIIKIVADLFSFIFKFD